MNLYKTSPSLSFVDILADFILNKFDNVNAITNLKIILPNGFACLNLQNILIKKQTIAILPTIVPFSNLMAEGEEIFGITPSNLDLLTFLHEKIILTEIIHNYPKLGFSITQSLQFCSTIAKLFHELGCNNLSIDDVNEIEQRTPSKQWDFIYEFIKYAHQEWQKKIKHLEKQDRINYQITMMQAEVDRLKNGNFSLIVAGTLGYDIISWNFLKQVAEQPTGFIVLPPISDLSNDLLQNISVAEEDCLYSLKKLLSILGRDLSDFQSLGICEQNYNIFDRLIIDNLEVQTSHPINHIKYFALEDIFGEAEQISLICKENIDKKIAIIIENQTIKNFYCNFLTKYSLEFQDLLGNDLSETHITSLIISISEVICNDFDIQKLFLLLKNPLINSDLVHKLELLMVGQNRFILTSSQMSLLIEKTSDNELIEWGTNLLSLLYQNNVSGFTQILKSSIKIAQKLYPDIWHEQQATELSNFITELIKINCHLTLNNKKDFPKLLKSLISSCKYFNTNSYSKNIIIGKAKDLMLIKFDLVILTNFNEGSYSQPFSSISQWISKQTVEQLHIDSIKATVSMYQYFFYLFLHNSQIIITRAKKQMGNSSSLQSNLLLKLQFILGKNLTSTPKLFIDNSIIPNKIELSKYITSKTFPEIISVTDIEMLVRNPYSFYAKKVLNLRSKDIVGCEPKISEFGSFVHKVLEQYTKYYNEFEHNKIMAILAISNDILNCTVLPSHTKKLWQAKFAPIAESFIEFDQQRRRDFKHIYSECRGEIYLNIAEQELKITGIADRIEINDLGQAIIIDYKTGTMPTIKEVELGVSPQLIIESIMLQQEGFSMKVNDVQQIMYVKISSSKPYIQTMKLDITKQHLDTHQQGMMRLLEFYIRNKHFWYDINLLKYQNDYAHLARLL